MPHLRNSIHRILALAAATAAAAPVFAQDRPATSGAQEIDTITGMSPNAIYAWRSRLKNIARETLGLPDR